MVLHGEYSEVECKGPFRLVRRHIHVRILWIGPRPRIGERNVPGGYLGDAAVLPLGIYTTGDDCVERMDYQNRVRRNYDSKRRVVHTFLYIGIVLLWRLSRVIDALCGDYENWSKSGVSFK